MSADGAAERAAAGLDVLLDLGALTLAQRYTAAAQVLERAAAAVRAGHCGLDLPEALEREADRVDRAIEGARLQGYGRR